MRHEEIDSMVGRWRDRMRPKDPATGAVVMNDMIHHVELEMIRRMAHIYDQAMELEGIPEETRRRVLSMILLGDPSGLEHLESQRIEGLLKQAEMYRTPKPIYFNPYSFPFHPDEPFNPKET